MNAGIHAWRWRQRLAATLMLMLVIATPIALNGLANRWVSAQLSELAARELGAAARDHHDLHWDMTTLDDLVAQRVFAATWFRIDPEGLHARGTSFEFGLRIPRSVDLVRYSRLSLAIGDRSAEKSVDSTSTKNTISIRILVREQLDQPEFASEPVSLATASVGPAKVWHPWLACLQWRNSATGGAVDAPRRAAMIRLRFESPQSQTLLINDVTLLGDPRFAPLDLSQGIQVISPVDPSIEPIAGPACPDHEIDTSQSRRNSASRKRRLEAVEAPNTIADLDALLKHANSAASIYLLPWFSHVEERLVWRDHVWAVQPDAILVPKEAIVPVIARANQFRYLPLHPHVDPWAAWIGALSFAGFVLWLRTRRSRSDLAELSVVLVPMLAAILLGGIGDNVPPPLLFLIATLLMYVASFAAEIKPALLRTGAPAAWLTAIAICAAVVAALLILRPQSEGQALPPTAVLLRYAAWVIVQQMILCVFVYERMQRLCRGKQLLAIWLCALLFALLHTPNAGLMIATYVGALLWLPLYHRWRALPPIIAAHFITAVALQSLASPAWVRSAEVSLRYLF